jgi:hypothetical protein
MVAVVVMVVMVVMMMVMVVVMVIVVLSKNHWPSVAGSIGERPLVLRP